MASAKLTFCKYLISTCENPNDCAAHLAEGRVFPCPYKSMEEAKQPNKTGGCCEDAVSVCTPQEQQ